MHNVLSEHFWIAVVNSVVFWFIAMVLLGLSYCFLDRVLLKGVYIPGELNKGNVAVGVVVASFLIGMALVIFGVTN